MIYVAAYLLTVFVEIPFGNLKRLIFPTTRTPMTKKEEHCNGNSKQMNGFLNNNNNCKKE
jgi:hypothetical protein